MQKSTAQIKVHKRRPIENPLLLDSVITVGLPAMRDKFSSTTKRQRGSPCIGKLQTHDELKKQNQNSRQC